MRSECQPCSHASKQTHLSSSMKATISPRSLNPPTPIFPLKILWSPHLAGTGGNWTRRAVAAAAATAVRQHATHAVSSRFTGYYHMEALHTIAAHNKRHTTETPCLCGALPQLCHSFAIALGCLCKKDAKRCARHTGGCNASP